MATLFERAIAEFGLTENPLLAGYLLPDGSLLNFSDSGYDRDRDHRQVEFLFPRRPDDEERSHTMWRFVDKGAVRWSYMLHGGESLYLAFIHPLTSAQLRVVASVLTDDLVVHVDRMKRVWQPAWKHYPRKLVYETAWTHEFEPREKGHLYRALRGDGA